MSRKALAIDGNCLMYHCFYATFKQLEYYKPHNLKPLNAFNIFVMSVIKLIHLDNYEFALVAFDHSKKTFRSEQYEEYKKGRKPMPIELVEQLQLIKNSCAYMGVDAIEMEGYEADDIIGSYASLMNKNNISVDIFTSDRDMLQLVNNLTTVKIIKSGVSKFDIFDSKNFSDKFLGLKPQQITDYKGLAGDNSDRIKGISGIGPKTAAKLLIRFKNLEGIYDHLDEIDNDKLKQKLNDEKMQAFLSKQLATIITNLLTYSFIEQFQIKKIDKDMLIEIANDNNLNQLKSFIKKL